ncbi:MAG TPA: aldolase/citrate lyase family protein [Vicinamibacterales bacterium]|nr:aldolase/citrate lyase family protein [Vicinamibacterales bacterium]
MTRTMISSAGALALVCVSLVAAQGQRQGAVAAAGGQQGANQPARGGGAGRGDAPTLGQGTLIGGVWGSSPLAVDARGWGWLSKAYVNDGFPRPFWNKAKELLFSGKQVTSFTIGAFDPTLYCEVRKHYGFVWFEMQHSTMSWDEVAKMIATCPGPDGAAPFIRMPDQQESSIQKATDLGAIGLIFPTIRDGHQALEAARYSRYPPFGRRSSGAGQAATVWSKAPGGYQNTFNDNMLVVVMIETMDGIINADEIAGTFGVDVVIQGNNDLSRFSGWGQNDARYQAMLTISRNATLRNGKWWGNAGQQYLTGNPLSADVRFVQNGPSMDGWTPPARGRGAAEEPTIGVPGRGRGGL